MCGVGTIFKDAFWKMYLMLTKVVFLFIKIQQNGHIVRYYYSLKQGRFEAFYI